MTLKEKKEFYKQMREKLAKDGKSHSSMLTKDGVFIDGKLYPFKKADIPKNRKSR